MNRPVSFQFLSHVAGRATRANDGGPQSCPREFGPGCSFQGKRLPNPNCGQRAFRRKSRLFRRRRRANRRTPRTPLPTWANPRPNAGGRPLALGGLRAAIHGEAASSPMAVADSRGLPTLAQILPTKNESPKSQNGESWRGIPRGLARRQDASGGRSQTKYWTWTEAKKNQKRKIAENDGDALGLGDRKRAHPAS